VAIIQTGDNRITYCTLFNSGRSRWSAPLVGILAIYLPTLCLHLLVRGTYTHTHTLRWWWNLAL